jgi:hypothetical protein
MHAPDDISPELAAEERAAPPADLREEFLLTALGVAAFLGNDAEPGCG